MSIAVCRECKNVIKIYHWLFPGMCMDCYEAWQEKLNNPGLNNDKPGRSKG